REFVVSPDQKAVLFTRTTVGEPVEICCYEVGTKALQRLTDFNQALANEVDIRPAETLWVDGADGVKVQVFVVKPHGFDPAKKYPLILNVHGGPQMMWSDTLRGDWQVYPGAGYVVAFPNPHGSTGYGQAFTDAISGDWDGKVMTDVAKVTDALAALPYVDQDRMGAMGWSWGGYAMMWLEGHPNRFKAIAAMMGVYDLRSMHGATEELWFPEHDLTGTPWDKAAAYERMNPSSHVKAFKTPCLVITGERDYRVPYTQSLQFFTGLQEMGVPSRLIVFKNDGHWPDNLKSMPVYYNAHLEWFQKYLGGGAAPWKTEDMMRNLAFDAKK
ncbi:MAG TPA: S9 family peptidase, partial [Geothrix sp.]|nr:S9 family peptidase [Geothrix sp.]